MTVAPARVAERYVVLYRRWWKSVVMNSLVQPLGYLLGMGLGVGHLVDRQPSSTETLGGVSYLAFVGPALIASTVMMNAALDALWATMDNFKWSQSFRAMGATSLTSGAIVNGAITWELVRGVVSGGGVAVVLVFFDDTRSWGLVAAVAFGAVASLAFALPVAAWSASRDRPDTFPAIMRFIVMPMFLFGGAFFPVSQLPGWLQPVAYATPLWHATELCRDATLSRLTWSGALGHGAVLGAYAVVGWLLCIRLFARRLAT